MTSPFQLDKKSVHKFELGEEPKDVLFWRTQPYSVRLAALEDIRQAYILWKYGTETTEAELDGVTVRFIGLEDLKKNKRSTGRLRDLSDVEELED